VKLRHTAADGYDDDTADYPYERGFAREGRLNERARLHRRFAAARRAIHGLATGTG